MRLEWLDALRGFLILLVVFAHCIANVIGNDAANENYLWRLIYSFHMPAFMAVSGYVSYKAGRAGDLIFGICRRFSQVMVPFMTWSIVLFICSRNVVHLYDYILMPNTSYWFLWALFFIVVIFNICDRLACEIHLMQEVAIVIMTVILIGLQMILPNSKLFGFEYIAYYFIYYSMGYYLHKYGRLVPSKKWVLVGLALLWFVLGSFWQARDVPIFIQWIHFLPSTILNVGYRILTATIFIIMMLGQFQKYKCTGKGWQLLQEFGKVSLGIYTIHMVLKDLLVKMLPEYLSVMAQFTVIFILFILLSLLSLWTVRLLGKNKFASIWLLGRSKKV